MGSGLTKTPRCIGVRVAAAVAAHDAPRIEVVAEMKFLLLALACRQPPVMPCGLSGVLGKPEFMLRYLRPDAEADLDVWREQLNCESFDRVAYTIGRSRVVAVASDEITIMIDPTTAGTRGERDDVVPHTQKPANDFDKVARQERAAARGRAKQ